MDETPFFLCVAGNMEVPACLVLSQKAYTVTALDNGGWYAEKGGLRFQVESLIELLGIVSVHDARDANWAAPDQEIDDFLVKYDH